MVLDLIDKNWYKLISGDLATDGRCAGLAGQKGRLFFDMKSAAVFLVVPHGRPSAESSLVLISTS
jgi:hypothetical protein